jgi:hypothetical protein
MADRAHDLMLRALKRCGDGFVTDALFFHMAGWTHETVRTYATRLRYDGHMVKRVQERGISGYKLVANAPVMQMAAE